jgi:peptide/nickel transport system substrate-binding protein
VARTTLTFKIRSGVKWSNGTPFTANDVAFTFNLLKKFPALDTNGLWTSLKSVTARGNTVVFVFKQPNVPDFNYIASTPIVPESIWSEVKNPVTWTNPNPIGTGAYLLKSYTPQEYVLVKNPRYWQASKVQVQEIEFPVVSENANTVWLNLSKGEYTAANAFAPNIYKIYISKDPKYRHIWFAPGGACNLLMNLTEAPFNNVAFRQAMAYAIDKSVVSSKGEYGYEPPASQTGLMLPANNSYLDRSLVNRYNYHYDPAKAAKLLKQAGFVKNSSGQLLEPGTKKPVSFTMIVPTGFSDWIEDAAIIQSNLKALGITVNVQTPSVSTWVSDMETGNFDMTLNFGLNQFNPYFYYQADLNSVNSAPIGKVATSNFERYDNPQVDALLTEYQQSTSPSQQHQIIDALQKVMLTQVPVIPMFYAANWNEYDTRYYVGWPTAANPYAVPTYNTPDVEMEFTHLRVR